MSILFSLNLLLFVFNLIPLPPLDGSGVIPLVLSEGKEVAFHSGPLGFVGIYMAWKLLDVMFSPAHCFFVSLLLYPGIGYH